ncbi:MAG: FkbM family methyltransferase, partial [Actinomycetota bacterium]
AGEDERLRTIRMAITEISQLQHRVSSFLAQNPGTPLPETYKPLIVEIRPDMRLEIFIDTEMEDPITHAYFWGQGQHVDPAYLGLMLSQLSQGDAVLDLGSFIGTYSLTAAAAGCRVVSVDASPNNAALLRASAARNGFRHLHVVHAAVSDSAGSVDFFAHGPWGRLNHEGIDKPTVSVWALRVDDLVSRMGWDRVSFIKMDVEGSEVAALRGMPRLLSGPDSPTIMFESNWHTLRFFGETPSTLLGTLEDYGYTSYHLEDGKLTLTNSEEFQPETVTNYLALKGPAPELEGWVVADPMSIDERISKLLQESRFDNPDHRVNFAKIIRDATAEIRQNPAIAQAMTSLGDDSNEEVREAARWWTAAAGAER